MSSSAFDVVSTTTGIVRSVASALISASTSRPSLRGRLRSSRIRSGRGASAYSPSRRRNRSASTPSRHDVQPVADLVVLERLLDQERRRRGRPRPAGRRSTSSCSASLMRRSPPRVRVARRQREDRTCAPRPSGAGASQIRPPWYSTILRHMARPMPVPSYAVARVQALEDDEDPLGVLGARCRSRCRCSVKRQNAPSRAGGDLDARRRLAAELDRVGDQVLEHRR